MRKLVVRIHASTVEYDLDDFYEEDEELNSDSLYDGFVHEAVTNPDYDWVVIDENGKEVDLA